jgi:predicted N-acyltransferase
MPDGSQTLTVTNAASIAEVDEAEWQACAGADNPFVDHRFLSALEASGSVAAETGWLPRHLCVRGADGRLLACAPLYLKSHSWGEYVFDWSWADAFERAGGRYYPKLQSAVPYSPVTGPRLLLAAGAPEEAAGALAQAMVALARRRGLSSVHVTFATKADCARFQAHGFVIREGIQYHWRNHGYGSFEAYLGALSSRKRKAIRKERAGVAGAGVRIRTLTGAEITARHWDAFYRFYHDTVERKWAHAYLNRGFFTELGARMGERVVMVVAETDGGVPVAGALNLKGGDALFGRYWGCAADYRFLHFEACYYRAIEYAIEHGLARVEAGAQGEHKIQRGYLPARTQSAHWIADAAFRQAVTRFLDQERAAVRAQMAELAAMSPFRRDGGAQG